MPIRQQIETIIANRQSNQTEFVNYFNRVTTIREFINGVNSFKTNTGWLTMINENEKLKKEWEALLADVNKLQDLLTPLCDESDSGTLIECLKRVKRDYLNIGCVGPWRQGKSTVISKLTSLSDYVIPRSKFLTCTGTTINIFNGNQIVWKDGQYIEKDGNKAVVYFHSFNSICTTINKYLKQLGLALMPFASTKETFVQNCTRCYHTNAGNPGTDSKLKKMLDTYLSQAGQYVDLIKPQDNMFEEIISLSSIESQQRLRPLVSYYEHPDKWYQDNGIQTPPQVFKVLAVKKVDVYTQFLVNGENGPEEVGRIQFVDTPGLGESKLEVADTLAKALRSDLDIAICLRKVSNQAGIIPNDSYDFHKVLKQNTYGRKPENWIFYLYNKEGNVSEDILQTTFKNVNDNLANTQESGLNEGQIVGGIKLRFNPAQTMGNHIDFIDAENDVDRLQRYFVSILTEMAQTISESDNAFYKEARDGFNALNNLYLSILNGSIRNVSQCLPTFDNREKIVGTLKNISDMWIDQVNCPKTLNESINSALANFYSEPYGVSLATTLGIEPEKIEKMSTDIKKVMTTTEYKAQERKEKREQIAKALIFPYIQKAFNENLRALGGVMPKFTTILNNLTDLMVKRASSYIGTTDILTQLEGVKVNIWRGMMNEGRLSFGKTNENEWLDYFMELLQEGDADFSALHSTIKQFRDLKFDIQDVIAAYIKSKIIHVSGDFNILYGNAKDLEDIQDSVFNTLFHAECETKASVYSDCKEVVKGQTSLTLDKFITEILDIQKTLIPLDKDLLTYCNEFEQLIKFYNKYASDIFVADEQANQKLAVQEWNVLKLKYVS